jgi:hypothetical protein
MKTPSHNEIRHASFELSKLLIKVLDTIVGKKKPQNLTFGDKWLMKHGYVQITKLINDQIN